MHQPTVLPRLVQKNQPSCQRNDLKRSPQKHPKHKQASLPATNTSIDRTIFRIFRTWPIMHFVDRRSSISFITDHCAQGEPSPSHEIKHGTCSTAIRIVTTSSLLLHLCFSCCCCCYRCCWHPSPKHALACVSRQITNLSRVSFSHQQGRDKTTSKRGRGLTQSNVFFERRVAIVPVPVCPGRLSTREWSPPPRREAPAWPPRMTDPTNLRPPRAPCREARRTEGGGREGGREGGGERGKEVGRD